MLFLGIVTLAFGVLTTLAGVEYQDVGIMLFGTIVGGTGFGTVYSGTLRSVLPYAEPGERAGLLSAYFVEGYLSFSLSRPRGRLPRTRRRPDANRKFLWHRRHPAGDRIARHYSLSEPARIVTEQQIGHRSLQVGLRQLRNARSEHIGRLGCCSSRIGEAKFRAAPSFALGAQQRRSR
jgi:hypothetical protein